MALTTLICECVSCRVAMTCSPTHVPSLIIGGVREPLCRACYTRWNEIHRVSKGLEPVPAHPDAWVGDSDHMFDRPMEY